MEVTNYNSDGDSTEKYEEEEKETEEQSNKKGLKPHPNDILFTWIADEYLHHERTVLWYITSFIVTILLIFYAVITSAWTMAVAVALMGAVVYLYSHEPPKLKEIVLTKLGIHFGHKYFPYHELDSFWIINEPNYKALVIKEVNRSEEIIILLPFDSVSEIRDILMTELPENEGKKETIINHLGRLLKI